MLPAPIYHFLCGMSTSDQDSWTSNQPKRFVGCTPVCRYSQDKWKENTTIWFRRKGLLSLMVGTLDMSAMITSKQNTGNPNDHNAITHPWHHIWNDHQLGFLYSRKLFHWESQKIEFCSFYRYLFIFISQYTLKWNTNYVTLNKPWVLQNYIKQHSINGLPSSGVKKHISIQKTQFGTKNWVPLQCNLNLSPWTYWYL